MKDFERNFPERLRPAMYAWAMQKDETSKAHLRELKWFIDQLEEYQEEQHSVLKSIPLVGTFLQQCFNKEEEAVDVIQAPAFLIQMDPHEENKLLRQAQLCGTDGTAEKKRLVGTQFRLDQEQLEVVIKYAEHLAQEKATQATIRHLRQNDKTAVAKAVARVGIGSLGRGSTLPGLDYDDDDVGDPVAEDEGGGLLRRNRSVTPYGARTSDLSDDPEDGVVSPHRKPQNLRTTSADLSSYSRGASNPLNADDDDAPSGDSDEEEDTNGCCGDCDQDFCARQLKSAWREARLGGKFFFLGNTMRTGFTFVVLLCSCE